MVVLHGLHARIDPRVRRLAKEIAVTGSMQLRARDSNSQRALHRLHPVAFDDVADLHVLVVLEGHPAFLAGDDFARVVLEALELGELALVHDDAIANETHIGAAFDHAIGDAATRYVADLGNLENLQDGGVTQHSLAHGRRQQAGHRLFHVVHEVVDDVVIADLDAGAFGGFARLLVGAHVEAEDRHARRLRQRHVGFGNAADTGMDHARADFVGGELLDRADDRFQRALHVGLDDQRQILAARGFELAHHLLERAAHAGRACGHLVAPLAGAIGGDFAGARLRLHDRQAVAGLGRAVEAEDFGRRGGPRGLDRRAGIGDQRAHAAPIGAGHDEVADTQRAALHQHGRNRSAAAVELASITVPSAGRFGLALRSRISDCKPMVSSNRSMLSFLVADTSTSSTSPPSDSTCTSCCSNSVRTRSGLASGRSILLIATIIGTFAALAWLMASTVCGMTPSSAATTSTTMSVTLAPRARMAVKAAWPGVSMKVILLPEGAVTW